ncbi:MAG TPA: hypothetical protein VGL86_22125 [Polyangia bacterium]|jgi:hypothetical protein
MTRLILALGLLAATGGVAFADDTRVRTSATVEVIDDRAQIDDVISRLRAQQARGSQGAATVQQQGNLKVERPAPPTATSDTSHRAVGPEPKDQRPGSRRINAEHGNPDHTERPKLKVRRR